MQKMITTLLIVTYAFHMLGTNAFAVEPKHAQINKIQVKVKSKHHSRQSEKNKEKEAKHAKGH